MIREKRPKVMLSLIMVLVIVGTANHCIFESFFVSFSNVINGIEVPNHLPNHLGSDTSHQHKDSSEPHEHGQPHSILALPLEKASSDLLLLVVLVSSLCFIASSLFGYTYFTSREKTLNAFRTTDPPGSIRSFIFSLTIAPQAPPI